MSPEFQSHRHQLISVSRGDPRYLSAFKRHGVKYFVIRVRRLHEGGVYSKSNLFLANNGVVTDLFNLKKHRHVIVPV